MRCEDVASDRILDLWTFKSKKTNKRYIVELEYITENFYAIKFYYKGVEKSKNRYRLLTNDFEPRTIIRSCVEVMIEFLRTNPNVSFGFVASDDLKEVIRNKKISSEIGNRRFRFYRRMMINLFGPESFYQMADIDSKLYLLLNKKEVDGGNIDISKLEDKINSIYFGDFSLYQID